MNTVFLTALFDSLDGLLCVLRPVPMHISPLNIMSFSPFIVRSINTFEESQRESEFGQNGDNFPWPEMPDNIGIRSRKIGGLSRSGILQRCGVYPTVTQHF